MDCYRAFRGHVESVPDTLTRNSALRVLDVLGRTRYRELRFMSSNTLASLAGVSSSPDELAGVLDAVVASGALGRGWTLFDAAENEYDISVEDVRRARALGWLAHPDTGARIERFEAMLVPYFYVSAAFMAAQAATAEPASSGLTALCLKRTLAEIPEDLPIRIMVEGRVITAAFGSLQTVEGPDGRYEAYLLS